MVMRIMLSVALVVSLAACQKQEEPAASETAKSTEVKEEATGDKTQPAAPAGEADQAEKVVENPFFAEFDTPFQVPPFSKIKIEHYEPAIEKGMQEHKKEIEAITNNPEEPTFKNTIEALDRSGMQLTKADRVFFSMLGANTNDELQKIAQEMSPKISKHRDDINLNQKLFERVKAVYNKKDKLELSVQQKNLINEFYENFVRGGANLKDKQKEKLREINKELALLTLKFSQNILKENNKFELVIDKQEDLAGLPETVVTTAAEAAKERGQEGKWVFTLHHPSLIPFLQYSDKRPLRKKMLKAYINRGDHDDELDNKENASKIAALRVKKAKLLGYKNFAEFILDRRMAKTPKKVNEFLNKLWKPAIALAKTEAKELQALIKKEGKKFKLQPWDWWHYAEKLRKTKYDLSEEELRPYFKLENVLEGAFTLANKLYGLKFKKLENMPIYHDEVSVYEVTKADGTHLAVFYTDFHPRASKRGGAWSGGFRKQYKLDGKKITPVTTNTCNFSKPTADKPALLSFNEVTTLFHEFGHGLHSMLNDTDYRGFGIRTDFVELPSQIMENWVTEPEFLKMYAKHYQTGQPIPDDLIEKINKSSLFNQGFTTVEYLAACKLDMDWHMLTSPKEVDTKKFEKRSLKKMGLIPQIVVRYRSPYFNHIFSGDFYAAGYYSYIWSGVLDADAFEAFKETSLFDQKTAKSFRDNILSQGGSEDPMELYIRFRGREPKIEPLLKRRGLKKL